MIQLKSWCPALIHAAFKFTPATWKQIPVDRLGANRSPLTPGRRRKHLAWWKCGGREHEYSSGCSLKVDQLCVGTWNLEPAAVDLRAETTLRGCRMPARGSILPSTSPPTASPSFSLLTCFFSLTCHHLKVSSERALFSLLISGWMERLKRSVNQGSSSGSVMQRPQAQRPLGRPRKADVKEWREESSQV